MVDIVVGSWLLVQSGRQKRNREAVAIVGGTLIAFAVLLGFTFR